MKEPTSSKANSPRAAGNGPGAAPNILTQSRTLLLVLLFAVGAALSGLLLLDHHGVSGAHAAVSQVCGEDDESGCEQVAQSPYSSIGGISVAGIGLLFYASLALLLFVSFPAGREVKSRVGSLLFGLLVLALGLDLLLLGLQTFSIGAFCQLCLATYAVNLAALVLVLPARSGLQLVPEFFGDGPGKPTATAWGLGSLALLVLIVAGESVLGARASQQQADVLGTPSVEQSLASAAETTDPALTDIEEGSPARSVEELQKQLEQARVEIHLLRRIIDDPKKYQEYRVAKATEEFEEAQQQDLDLTNVPSKGADAAPIRVVEYSDFLCPYCSRFATALNQYLPKSAGRVGVYFKNYPLDQECNPGLKRTIHPGACRLALGAICTEKQGRFWAYHDMIFANPPKNPSLEDVVALAAQAGADRDAVWACVGSAAAREELTNQIEEAKRVEVKSTPTIFVNGKKLPNPNLFLKAVEAETKRLGL